MKKILSCISSLEYISVAILFSGMIIALLYFGTGIAFHLKRFEFDDITYACACRKAALSSCEAMCIVTLIGTFVSDYSVKHT